MNNTLTPIRVFVADDHPMIRQGLAAMIQAERSLKWVGEATNGTEAISFCATVVPDVVLMDLMMPDIDGVAATQAIVARAPNTRVLILTSYHEPEVGQRAVQAGAAGYLVKTASADELIRAIHVAHSGKRVLASEATEALIQASQSDPMRDSLTEREREILALLAKGLSNAEIAAKLFVTVPTVKYHVTNILSKLQVDSRTEAVLVAMKHRLVPPQQ